MNPANSVVDSNVRQLSCRKEKANTDTLEKLK